MIFLSGFSAFVFIIVGMKNKYTLCGLNYDLISEAYPDLNEYERILHIYLEDDFFNELKTYIETEDYAMAKDAIKGLYIMASELKLFELYTHLVDLYEDIDIDNYQNLLSDYAELMLVHKKIKAGFLC